LLKLLYLQPVGDGLYDAFVSIDVPSDKAWAVVDAMERDMGTTLATKQDLEMTIKLGSMFVVGTGLVLAALRFWT
jgi:hypothetical protein